MRITLTPEQAAELDNPLYDIPYTVTIDGTDYEGNVDDKLRELPIPLVGDLAHNGDPEGDGSDISEYYMADPRLTWQDEIVLKHLLDERATFTAALRAAPRDDRPAMRSAKRTELRQAARADTRKEARVKLRVESPQEARRQLRQDMRQEAVIAAKIAAEQAVRDPQEGPV